MTGTSSDRPRSHLQQKTTKHQAVFAVLAPTESTRRLLVINIALPLAPVNGREGNLPHKGDLTGIDLSYQKA